MAEQFQYLFSPIEVGNVTVPNRIVVPGHYPALRDLDQLPGERLTGLPPYNGSIFYESFQTSDKELRRLKS